MILWTRSVLCDTIHRMVEWDGALHLVKVVSFDTNSNTITYEYLDGLCFTVSSEYFKQTSVPCDGIDGGHDLWKLGKDLYEIELKKGRTLI